jgi:hypothetical protein
MIGVMLAGMLLMRARFCMSAQARKRKRTSSFRGVTKAGRKWRAALRVNNAKKELGTFDDELEAARRVRHQSIDNPLAPPRMHKHL